MDGGMLSQDEINALLNGDIPPSADSGSAAGGNGTLTEEEKDAVGEIANISMGTAATTLYSLVNKKVTITTPQVSYATWDNVVADYDRPYVFIQIYYKVGLDGNNVLVLKEQDVKIITDLMMGGDGTNTDGELGELHLSAISEAMNQMMGSAATSLSNMLTKTVDISPPTASLVDLNSSINEEDISPFLAGEFIKIAFKMEIEGLVDSEIMQLYPVDFAKELYESFKKTMQGDMSADPTPEPPTPTPAPELQQQPQNMMDPNMMGMQNMGMPMQQNMGMQNMGMPMQQNMGMQNMGMPMQNNVNVQPAQFQNFAAMTNPIQQQENIDLILDVALDVTVELGRTKKSIHDILEFAPGTIIELNKIAGEPIDVLVNGKFVAKGEVVVIEESFGIRVTEIIK